MAPRSERHLVKMHRAESAGDFDTVRALFREYAA
jgi:hypothetical protein